ncbi:MAG: hypothetical protein WKG01_15925 [Kofleriaceae bacterium]
MGTVASAGAVTGISSAGSLTPGTQAIDQINELDVAVEPQCEVLAIGIDRQLVGFAIERERAELAAGTQIDDVESALREHDRDRAPRGDPDRTTHRSGQLATRHHLTGTKRHHHHEPTSLDRDDQRCRLAVREHRTGEHATTRRQRRLDARRQDHPRADHRDHAPCGERDHEVGCGMAVFGDRAEVVDQAERAVGGPDRARGSARCWDEGGVGRIRELDHLADGAALMIEAREAPTCGDCPDLIDEADDRASRQIDPVRRVATDVDHGDAADIGCQQAPPRAVKRQQLVGQEGAGGLHTVTERRG